MSDASCALMDLGCHAAWLQDEVKGFFVWLSEQVFNGIVAVFNAIPLPSWATSGGDVLSGIPPSVGYFVGPFDIGYGAGVIVSAYGLRFLVRRIPLIG